LLVVRGIKELVSAEIESDKGRIRKQGAGRKKESERQNGLVGAIEGIVSPHTGGDPMRVLLWTNKCLRSIQEELENRNYKI
jgi:hypothetical protein